MTGSTDRIDSFIPSRYSYCLHIDVMKVPVLAYQSTGRTVQYNEKSLGSRQKHTRERRRELIVDNKDCNSQCPLEYGHILAILATEALVFKLQRILCKQYKWQYTISIIIWYHRQHYHHHQKLDDLRRNSLWTF